MVVNKIETMSLQEAVYQELLTAIVSGKLAPGERIILAKMAKDLDVSVMPVREAIRRLQARHFITIEKNKQIIVNHLSPRIFNQVLEARKLLEGHVVKIASKIRSDASIKKLERLHRQLEKEKDDETALEINREFHRAIYQEADLPILLDIIDSLWERVSPYFYQNTENDDYWAERIFMEYHLGMLEGMQQKKPAITYKWLIKDLTVGADAFLSMIEKSENKD